MDTLTISNELMMAEIRKAIAEGKYVQLRCKGNSMNPFLVSGRDSLLLYPFTDEDIVPGAVILGKDVSGRYLVHRIVGVKDDYVILNGDGNFQRSYEKVMKSEILAAVKAVVRKDKQVSFDSRKWRLYSAFWRFAAKLRIGNISLRRVCLSIWRRTHPGLILDTRNL